MGDILRFNWLTSSDLIMDCLCTFKFFVDISGLTKSCSQSYTDYIAEELWLGALKVLKIFSLISEWEKQSEINIYTMDKK